MVPDLVKWWFQIGVAWLLVWFLGDGFDTIETWVSSVDVTVLSALIVNLYCAASDIWRLDAYSPVWDTILYPFYLLNI